MFQMPSGPPRSAGARPRLVVLILGLLLVGAGGRLDAQERMPTLPPAVEKVYIARVAGQSGDVIQERTLGVEVTITPAGATAPVAVDPEKYQVVFRPENKFALARKEMGDAKNVFRLQMTTLGDIKIDALVRRQGQTEPFKKTEAPLTVKVVLPPPAAVDRVELEQATPGSLVVDQEFQLRVNLFDDQGHAIPRDNYHHYTLRVTAEPAAGARAPQPVPNTASRYWTTRLTGKGRATFTAFAKRHASAGGESDGEKSGTLALGALAVQGFVKITTALDRVDERTASYLYGRKMAEEYHIMKLTIVNDHLADPNDPTSGRKLIVYGPSLEIRVTFEKKYDPSTKSDVKEPEKPDKWQEVTLADSAREFNVALATGADRDLPPDMRQALEAEVRRILIGTHAPYQLTDPQTGEPLKLQPPENEVPLNRALLRLLQLPAYTIGAEDRKALLEVLKLHGITPGAAEGEGNRPYEASLKQLAAAPIRPLSRDQVFGMFVLLERNGVLPIPYTARRFSYRPYSYDVLAQTVDPRDARSLRSRTFGWLTFIGEMASATISVAKANPFITSVVEKYGNIFIPSLGKLWPSTTERERQHLRENALRDLEEVPFGGQINRMLFIPRKPIKGMLRGYQARVAEVHTSYVQVRVAVVQQDAEATSNGR